MIFFSDFGAVLLAAVLGGGTAGWLGGYIVGMRIPLMAITISHAAMAGAVLAVLMGWPVTVCALLGALLTALLVAWLTPFNGRGNADTILSIMFCLMMGLAFLGIGLNDGAMAPTLALMRGNLLFVTWMETVILALVAMGFAGFVIMFNKELKALLFSPMVAIVSGIRVRIVFVLFLLVGATVMAINLKLVGGLLLYALVTIPAAAAYTISSRVWQVFLCAWGFGVLSALGGFLISYLSPQDLPTGACIVLFSTGIYSGCVLWRWLVPTQ